MSDPVLTVDQLMFSYPGAKSPAIRDVTQAFERSRVTAILGPNGAGKSTLVRLLTGILPPARGSVRFLGRSLADWGRAELARSLAVVAQEPPPTVTMRVEDYVSLGRNPHLSPWAGPGERDRVVVDGALDHTTLADLRARLLTDLSGGELQRAKLARALVQEPVALILDEPTVHLDIRHALWTFEMIRDLADEKRVTIICITHDMNMASRFADEIVLLSRGAVSAAGEPARVLTNAALRDAYECEVEVASHGALGLTVVPVAGQPRGSPGAAP